MVSKAISLGLSTKQVSGHGLDWGSHEPRFGLGGGDSRAAQRSVLKGSDDTVFISRASRKPRRTAYPIFS
jgi:hypothetical protein